MNYLSSMPGNSLHIIFDNYSYEFRVSSKQRDAVRWRESLTA